MSEIQQLLKQTLHDIQNQNSDKLNAQHQILQTYQHKITTLEQSILHLQKQINQISNAQQESEKNLELLSDILKSLEPLLLKLTSGQSNRY